MKNSTLQQSVFNIPNLNCVPYRFISHSIMQQINYSLQHKLFSRPFRPSWQAKESIQVSTIALIQSKIRYAQRT